MVCGVVRETSRKPDEMYSLLERLYPGSRKLEIFARPLNCQVRPLQQPLRAPHLGVSNLLAP